MQSCLDEAGLGHDVPGNLEEVTLLASASIAGTIVDPKLCLAAWKGRDLDLPPMGVTTNGKTDLVTLHENADVQVPHERHPMVWATEVVGQQ